MTKNNQKIHGQKELIGTIMINNMIPVPKTEITKIDISHEKDGDYKNLLINEYKWISDNKDLILRNSKNLYWLKINEHIRKTSKNEKMLEATLDFKNLEKALVEFKNKYE